MRKLLTFLWLLYLISCFVVFLLSGMIVPARELGVKNQLVILQWISPLGCSFEVWSQLIFHCVNFYRTFSHLLPTNKAYAASSGDESGASSNHLSPSDGNVNGFHPDDAKPANFVGPALRVSPTEHTSFYTAPKRAEVYRAPPGADGEKTNSFSVSTDLGSVKDRLAEVQPSERTSGFQRDARKARSQKRLAAYCTAMESIEASAQPVELEKEELDLIP